MDFSRSSWLQQKQRMLGTWRTWGGRPGPDRLPSTSWEAAMPTCCASSSPPPWNTTSTNLRCLSGVFLLPSPPCPVPPPPDPPTSVPPHPQSFCIYTGIRLWSGSDDTLVPDQSKLSFDLSPVLWNLCTFICNSISTLLIIQVLPPLPIQLLQFWAP